MTRKAKTLTLSVCATIALVALGILGATQVKPSVSLVFGGFTTNREGRCALMVLTNQGSRPIIAFRGGRSSSVDWERVVPPPPPFREPDPSELRPGCRVENITLASSQGIAFEVPIAGLKCLQVETDYRIAEPNNPFWLLIPSKIRWEIEFRRERQRVRSPLLTLEPTPH